MNDIQKAKMNVLFWLAFAPPDYGFSLRVDETSPW